MAKTFTEAVRLGRITVTVENDDLEEHLKEVSEIKTLADRVQKGGDLQHRIGTDENHYFEVVYNRPGGRVTRKIGKAQKAPNELFISATEPYTRYNRETGQNEVMFDFLTDDLRKAGFTEDAATNGNFQAGERVKLTKSAGGGWAWKAL